MKNMARYLLLTSLLWTSSALAIYTEPDWHSLSLTWGPGFCKTNRCSGETRPDFTIHGLWPEQNTGFRTNCKQDSLDTSLFDSDLKDQLNKNWISYKGQTESFWKYQWEKHGTCCGQMAPNQEQYFRLALEERNKLGNIINTLKNDNIEPSTTQIYSKNQLVTSLTKVNGMKPQIRCNSRARGIVDEILFCYTKELAPKDCSEPWGRRLCPDQVQLLSN